MYKKCGRAISTHFLLGERKSERERGSKEKLFILIISIAFSLFLSGMNGFFFALYRGRDTRDIALLKQRE
jgi:hypothetical protein